MSKKETVVLKYQSHCPGCLRKIQKAITDLKDVETIEYDYKEKKVTLYGNINPQKVLKKVRRTGKQIEMLQPKESKEADKKDEDQAKKDTDKKDSNKNDTDKKDSDKKGLPWGEDNPKKCVFM